MSEEIKTNILDLLKQSMENDGNQTPIEFASYIALHTLSNIMVPYIEDGVNSITDVTKAKHELTYLMTNNVTNILNIIFEHYYNSSYTQDRYYIDYMKHITDIQKEVSDYNTNAFKGSNDYLNDAQKEYFNIANSLFQINFILIRDVISNMIWKKTHARVDTCIVDLYHSDLKDGEFIKIISGIEINNTILHARIDSNDYMRTHRLEYRENLDGKSHFSIGKTYKLSHAVWELIKSDHCDFHVLTIDSIPKYNFIILY